jgi:hypothetical protein
VSSLLAHDHVEPPVFLPKNLVEGARRQKRLALSVVPAGCLLDMDGELVERLAATGCAILDPDWQCFHTRLHRWAVEGAEYGVVAGTVGAPFSVLVAEELFASGSAARRGRRTRRSEKPRHSSRRGRPRALSARRWRPPRS